MPDPESINQDPKHCFLWQKNKRLTAEKKEFNIFTVFEQKVQLFILRPPYRTEAFSPQKRTSSTCKTWNFLTFNLFLWVFFALLDPDSESVPIYWLDWIPIRVRIRNTGLYGILFMGLSLYRTQYRVTVGPEPQAHISLPILAPLNVL